MPFDSKRLVFPPIGAAFLAFLFYFPFTKSLPGGYGLAMFAGGLLGYVLYDLTHYYLHHGTPPRGSYLHSLKYYHVLHHFDDHSTGKSLYHFLASKSTGIFLLLRCTLKLALTFRRGYLIS